MHLIGSIIIGFIVGLIARFVKPGKDAMGWVLTTVLGVVGSLIATFLGRAMGMYGADDSAGFIASVVGAVVVLGIYSAVKGRGTNRSILTDRDRRAA